MEQQLATRLREALRGAAADDAHGDLTFGLVPRGGSATRTITLQNTGSGDLDVLNVRLGPSTDSAYSLSSASPTAATLAPGHSAVFQVKFLPPASASSSGPRIGSL